MSRTGTAKPPVVRFFRYVDKTPGGCWIWTGGVGAQGYGTFRSANGTRSAHRWAFEHFVGPVPRDLHLDHVCHSSDTECPGGACTHRRCVNPEHLEPVTPRENTNRGRGNPSKTHCPAGHPYDEANTYRRSDGRRACRECRAQAPARRAVLLLADPSLAPHGSTSTYENWRCRCADCRAAMAVKNAGRYAKAAA